MELNAALITRRQIPRLLNVRTATNKNSCTAHALIAGIITGAQSLFPKSRKVAATAIPCEHQSVSIWGTQFFFEHSRRSFIIPVKVESPHIRIAVDAMGGDHAPANVIAGAIEALRECNNRFEVLFVGPESTVNDQLLSVQQNGFAYRVIDAPQVVNMHDPAMAALKEKRNSSISIGISLHKDGNADAFVSAGHSGAVMSTSTLVLGRIEGIGRPTIGAFFPSEQGVCLLLDAGVNVDCKPQHLYEFAVMGSIYTSEMFQVNKPTVGLLNIGEEESKGNEIVREAHRLLQQSKLNFIGNVEGRDILLGKAQVVVCDGFVGNVILKFGESVPEFFKSRMKQVMGKSLWMKVV